MHFTHDNRAGLRACECSFWQRQHVVTEYHEQKSPAIWHGGADICNKLKTNRFTSEIHIHVEIGCEQTGFSKCNEGIVTDFRHGQRLHPYDVDQRRPTLGHAVLWNADKMTAPVGDVSARFTDALERYRTTSTTCILTLTLTIVSGCALLIHYIVLSETVNIHPTVKKLGRSASVQTYCIKG